MFLFAVKHDYMPSLIYLDLNLTKVKRESTICQHILGNVIECEKTLFCS